MRKRVLAWFSAISGAVAAGIIITAQFLADEAAKAKVTCEDAQQIVKLLGGDADALLFTEWLMPKDCVASVKRRCYVLPNNTVCRGGRAYGPGQGGSYDPHHKDPALRGKPLLCDPALGREIPCSTRDGRGATSADLSKLDKKVELPKLIERLKERLGEDLAEKLEEK